MSSTKIKTIIVSQPKPTEPEKSPFFAISKKYGVKIEYRKFFKVERLTSREFREQKIYLQDYKSIIFTSRMAVDYYFSMSKDLRFDIPDSLKYYCTSEAIALYLQKYIQFRKRKIFFSNNNQEELADLMKKHETDVFLLPCSGDTNETLSGFLSEKEFKIQKAIFFNNVNEDLKDLKIESYDMLVVFSPSGVKSLKENFPEFNAEGKVFAVFGDATAQAVIDSGWKVEIKTPTEKHPSITMAIEEYLSKCNKKK